MDLITRRGPIFKIGSYPDKAFSLNADEATHAIAAFAPVPIDSEHKGSVFDGKLGELSEVELRGDTLHGAIRVPQWLHDLFPEQPIPVSTTWSRGPQKQIIGLALAKNPRVSEAAMMAAFSSSRHDTLDGHDVHQSMHDMAARHGAICNDPAAMISRHESSGLQAIHDTTLQHGATCNAMGQLAFSDELALFIGKRNNVFDQKSLDAAHEAIVKAGAVCAGAATMHKESSMDQERQGFLNWLFNGAAKPAAELTPAAFALQGEPQIGESAEVTRLKAALVKATADRITSDATHFADDQIAAHKALPAERESIIAAFAQAAQDDGAHGVVTFADGHTSSRVAQLTAMFSARPAHTLTQELIKTEQSAAVFANQTAQPGRATDAAQPMSKERRAELLGLTGLGRDVLKNGN